MITFTCPGCQATFKLPDELAGKSARCSKCNQRFTVPGGAPKPAPVAALPKKAVLKPVAQVFEAEVVDAPARRPQRPAAIDKVEVVDDVQVVDNVEVVDQVDVVEVVDDGAIQPTRRAQLAPNRGARVEEDDDRPRRRDRDRWEDDDEDDLDRPRRKRRKKRSRSRSSMGVIMASIGGGSFILTILFAILASVTDGGRPPNFNNPPPFAQNPPPFNPNPPPVQQGKAGNQPAQGGAGAITLVNGAYDTQDRLTAGDAFDKVVPNHRAKSYSVQLQAGKTYIIDMRSVGNPRRDIDSSFDPLLRVEKDGRTVAEDDDGGEGHLNLDARIVFAPPQTGVYVIVATTFNPLLGGYQLSIREVR